MTEKKITKF